MLEDPISDERVFLLELADLLQHVRIGHQTVLDQSLVIDRLLHRELPVHAVALQRALNFILTCKLAVSHAAQCPQGLVF